MLKSLNAHLPQTEMCSIARKYGTDKFTLGYTRVYDNIMRRDKDNHISILEIGIFTGASLRMWHEYFRNAKVCGIDNGRLVPNAGIKVSWVNENMSEDDKRLLNKSSVVKTDFSWIENDRIKCATADQRCGEQLESAFQYFGANSFDYIIDDGQHFQEHQQVSLGLLFPKIKPGGYYIIEDVIQHTNLLNGQFWGQKNQDCSDSTDSVMSNFIKTGTLSSPYLTCEQIKYITDNIADIFLYDAEGKSNSPISGSSKLLVLQKK